MKLAEYKENIKERFYLIKMNLEYSSALDLATLGKNWVGLLSTIFYNLTFIAFIGIVYSKVKSVAGFSFDEMMVLVFIGEITINLTQLWIRENIDDLIETVRSGDLDLVLNKPLPALWYLSFKKFDVRGFLRDGLPPIIMIFFFIHWANLNLNAFNVISSIAVVILGQIIIHCIFFIAAILEGFWERKYLFEFVLQMLDDLGRRIPGEGYSLPFRFLFLSILPIGVAMGLSTSVILGKINNLLGLSIAILATIFSLIVKVLVWKKALREYSSASS